MRLSGRHTRRALFHVEQPGQNGAQNHVDEIEGIIGGGDSYGPMAVAKSAVDTRLKPSITGADPK